MLNKIKELTGMVMDKAGEAALAGFEQLKGPLEELSAAATDLEQVGYHLGDIELICGLPPRIVVYFTRHTIASEEAFQAMLANYAQQRTVRTVISLLQQANQLMNRMPIQGRECKSLIIDLGLPPSFRIVYGATPTTSKQFLDNSAVAG